MPDIISRQRLMKKVLDRWENEGGRIIAEHAAETRGSVQNERIDENKQ